MNFMKTFPENVCKIFPLLIINETGNLGWHLVLLNWPLFILILPSNDKNRLFGHRISIRQLLKDVSNNVLSDKR